MAAYNVLSQNGFIMVNRALAKAYGLAAAAVLGDLCTRREQHGDGFWATNEQLMDSTSLGIKAVRKALEVLKEAGFIETKMQGVPQKRYFHIDDDAIAVFLLGPDASPEPQKPSDASRKPSDSPKTPDRPEGGTGAREPLEKPAEAVSEPHEDLELRAPDPAESVLAYLNEKAGRRFKPIASTLSNIRARLKEGYTVADCEKVIDSKVGEWSGTDMAKYLTPQTLFRPSHFDTYLNTVDVDTTSRAPEQKGAPDAPMGDTWRPARSYDEARLKRVRGLIRTAMKAGNPGLIQSIAKSEGLTEEECRSVMEAVR